MPDAALPFLGAHFTPRMDGEVWIGPNAVVALAREGYRRSAVNLRDLLETLTYPGFVKLTARHFASGLRELIAMPYGLRTSKRCSATFRNCKRQTCVPDPRACARKP